MKHLALFAALPFAALVLVQLPADAAKGKPAAASHARHADHAFQAIAVAVGWLRFHESLGLLDFAGMAAVAAGLALARSTQD